MPSRLALQPGIAAIYACTGALPARLHDLQGLHELPQKADAARGVLSDRLNAAAQGILVPSLRVMPPRTRMPRVVCDVAGWPRATITSPTLNDSAV